MMNESRKYIYECLYINTVYWRYLYSAKKEFFFPNPQYCIFRIVLHLIFLSYFPPLLRFYFLFHSNTLANSFIGFFR